MKTWMSGGTGESPRCCPIGWMRLKQPAATAKPALNLPEGGEGVCLRAPVPSQPIPAILLASDTCSWNGALCQARQAILCNPEASLEKAWHGTPHALGRRRIDGGACRRRRDAQQPPRDEYLRPMVDTTGIRYRIGLNEDEMTEDIREEFEENQRESWAALRFAGELLAALPMSGAAFALQHEWQAAQLYSAVALNLFTDVLPHAQACWLGSPSWWVSQLVASWRSRSTR